MMITARYSKEQYNNWALQLIQESHYRMTLIGGDVYDSS